MMSEGVVITLVLTVKPEAVDSFAVALPEMFKDTRARKGFRNIRAVCNQSDPTKLMFLEEWDSVQDYEAYLAWRAERGENMDAMAAILAAPPVLEIWDKQVG